MKVRDVGRFIRDQRRAAQLSLRNLAKLAGISNPYLSQIERGLRRPSAEILSAIAKALRISAETLYVKAGILDDRRGHQDLASAILADTSITERQKQALIQIYSSFREETERRRRARPKGGARPRATGPSSRAGGRVESAG
ncbi:MAG TPA: helix-turn-helix transcriptional regulator [Actinomycetota bacterium]|nr:helix-turn-helix transcriptional regulator [Actinomycetota bacterium]